MVKVGARLRTRLGLAWPGSGSMSHSALFGAGFIIIIIIIIIIMFINRKAK